jgi:hypothetical protein
MYERCPTDFKPLFDPGQEKRVSLADRIRGFLGRFRGAL